MLAIFFLNIQLASWKIYRIPGTWRWWWIINLAFIASQMLKHVVQSKNIVILSLNFVVSKDLELYMLPLMIRDTSTIIVCRNNEITRSHAWRQLKRINSSNFTFIVRACASFIFTESQRKQHAARVTACDNDRGAFHLIRGCAQMNCFVSVCVHKTRCRFHCQIWARGTHAGRALIMH